MSGSAGRAVVARLSADDWAAYREIRLRALAESPTAFGFTLAREQAFTEADWRRRARRASVAYLGEVSGHRQDPAVGVVGWAWDEPPSPARKPPVADLVAMWVAPAARGRGVGRALIADVVAQVVAERKATLELGVVEANADAVALYRRAGFIETGREIGRHTGTPLLLMRYVGSPNAAALRSPAPGAR